MAVWLANSPFKEPVLASSVCTAVRSRTRRGCSSSARRTMMCTRSERLAICFGAFRREGTSTLRLHSSPTALWLSARTTVMCICSARCEPWRGTNTLAMPGIPPALDTDTEDVTWALQTAEALWKRNERVDALVWLRRAAQAAGEAEHDDRALELANDGAELAEWLAGHPQPTSASLSAFPLSNVRTNANWVDESRATHPDEVEELSVDVILDSTPSLPRERMDTPMVQHDRTARGRVPSGAEKHAGMLDPWADGEANISAPGAGHEPPSRPPSGSRAPDTDEVVTSAPLIAPAPGLSSVRSTPSRSSGLPSGPKSGVDLSGVDALSDLPDDAREAFARAAVVHQLSRNEEASGFALALILEGSLDLAATILDTPAQRMEA